MSGAPAKVFVQGLGAAFTAFLVGQTGAKFLMDGSHVNAWSILLSCFLGAVFAEEIWAQAKGMLPKAAGAPKPVSID